MAKDKMTVDEFLDFQKAAGNLATVESIENDLDNVKITPWVPNRGCLCQMALTIPRSAIEYVEKTKELHFCCNKALPVAQVQFAKDSSISLTDLFQQLATKAAGEEKEPQRPLTSEVCQRRILHRTHFPTAAAWLRRPK